MKQDIYISPKAPGIYYLYSKRKKLVYIGQAKNIRIRLVKHNSDLDYFKLQIKKKGKSFSSQAKPFKYFRYTIIKDEKIRNIVEGELIKELKPRYNSGGITYKNPKFERYMFNCLAMKMRRVKIK